MAEYITFQPRDYYSTKLYTGTGATQAITGVGFQPDMTWIKARTATTNHQLGNSVAAQPYYYLKPNLESAEITSNSDTITSFDSDGFTMGNDGVINDNTITYASWNWKAGTTSGISGGTITPTGYSFNTTSGTSIVRYTGNNTSGATVPHGLGAAPELILLKDLDGTNSWQVYSVGTGNTIYLSLDTSDSQSVSSNRWNDTSPTSTVFSLGDSAAVNGSGNDYMAFCFAPKKGSSAFGKYTGTGNIDGTFIYTGFRPAFVMIKGYDVSALSWYLWDNKRLGYNPDNNLLYPNGTTVENSLDYIDILSNGFKFRTTDGEINGGGTNYIYSAFAEFPLVSSNDVPGVAR